MSDLPDSETDLIGEGSVHPSQYNESEYNWLLNLDVDHDTAEYQAATPISIRSTVPSTPALPLEVSGSDHKTTPARFSPEPQETDQIDEIEEDQGTISDRTYENISDSSVVRHPSLFGSTSIDDCSFGLPCPTR